MKQKQNWLVLGLVTLFFFLVIGMLQLFVHWQDNHYSQQAPHQTAYSLLNKQQMPLSNAEALTVVTEYANPIKFKSDVYEAGGVDLKKILAPVVGGISNDLQILDVEKRVYHSTNGGIVATYYVSAMSKTNEIDFEFVPSNNLILNLQCFGDNIDLPLQTIAQNWRNNINVTLRHQEILADGEISQQFVSGINYRLAKSNASLVITLVLEESSQNCELFLLRYKLDTTSPYA